MTEAAEQGDLGFDGGGPDYDRLREFDADFTPGPVVHQGLATVAELLPEDPALVLDPSAGAGVFGQQAKVVWPSARLIGLEPRAEEGAHLAQNYTRHATTTFQEWAEGDIADARPNLIATNPPFSLFPEFVELGLDLLSDTGMLMLLGLSTWGQSADGIRLFDRFWPALQIRIGGRIGFRGPGINPKNGKPWGVDQRDYSWWIWVPGRIVPRFYGRPYWRTLQLPVLSTAQRTWREKPGTEGR
jgi:hypothetical protein